MPIPSRPIRGLCSALGVALLGWLPADAAAQLSVTRFTIDGGGGRCSGGSLGLGGTIGQPDAGQLSGSNFTLSGGFWLGGGNLATSVEPDPTGPAPLAFRLHPSFPNPVAHRSVVAFELPAPSFVRAALYSVSGRLVRVLVNESLPAGKHQRVWNRCDRSGSSVASGIYFLRIVAGADRSQQKIVVIQ